VLALHSFGFNAAVMTELRTNKLHGGAWHAQTNARQYHTASAHSLKPAQASTTALFATFTRTFTRTFTVRRCLRRRRRSFGPTTV